MILGDVVSKLKTFVWILNHISRSITWSLFILKASYLVKWPISTWSFIWWCQFIDYIKFWNSPQFPDEFWNGWYLARNLNLRKLALSCNELTNHSSGMNFDTMIYPSVKPQLSMKNVGFSNRQRLKVSLWNLSFKVYILKWRRQMHSHNLWSLLVS